MGNYNDSMMEKISNAGNGNYFYIDELKEAQKILGQEVLSTLYTIAKDVKIQVEFNPTTVKSYRLLGYVNRALADKDFANDQVDAGELGPAHQVTALYELRQKKSDHDQDPATYRYQKKPAYQPIDKYKDELLLIKLRYKLPKSEKGRLIKIPIKNKLVEKASPSFKLAAAVAMWGMLLRDSPYKNQATFDQVLTLARSTLSSDKNGYRKAFLSLVEKTKNQSIRN